MNDNKKESSGLFSWKMSDEELKHQVENYDNIKFTKSYKGISTIIMLVLLGLSILLAFFEIISLDDILVGLIFYLPIIYFVIKGHRWAIIALMILWTVDKWYMLYDSYEMFGRVRISHLFWWAIIMPYFYKTLKVENERRKLIYNKVETDKVANNIRYCSNCGNKISTNKNFCSKCGNKIN